MTKKDAWSHKAFPPCLAQRVHCADDPIQFCRRHQDGPAERLPLRDAGDEKMYFSVADERITEKARIADALKLGKFGL